LTCPVKKKSFITLALGLSLFHRSGQHFTHAQAQSQAQAYEMENNRVVEGATLEAPQLGVQHATYTKPSKKS